MRPPILAFATGKGGTGKTSLTSNVAGLAAEYGYRVLAVDLDPQGNLGRDLGYYGDEARDDGGQALLEAMAFNRSLTPLTNVRPNLDVVVGGPHLDSAAALATSWERQGRVARRALAEALNPLVGGYHLVVLDCPPGERFLQESAMCAASHVVIPTRSDEASLDGLTRVADTFSIAREHNPDLQLLGVVLFGITATGTALVREVTAKIRASLGDVAPVLDTRIRYLEAPAVGARDRGLLVHEYERDLVRSAPRFWERRNADSQRLGGAGTANKLATDYAALTTELLATLFADRATPATVGGVG